MPSTAQLVLVGTNHTRAPVAVRERLAAHDHGRELLEVLTGSSDVAEAVGLSTCNRCELYMVGADVAAMRQAAVGSLGHLSGHAAERLEPMLYVHHGEAAARHLFGVAGGLDSMVPGEAQILAQIREAYESAYEWDTTGPVTNRLFHQALEAGKRVRHETAIGEGGASPASVAAELAADRLGGELSTARVLVVGAGRVAELVAANLRRARRGIDRGRQPRRNQGGGAGLAIRRPGGRLRGPAHRDRRGGRRRRLDLLARAAHRGRRRPRGPARADRPRRPARHRPRRRRRRRGLAAHDRRPRGGGRAHHLAAPRRGRPRQEIVAAQAAGFRDWMAALEVVPAITSLRAHAERIRVSELERARLGDLSEAERERLDAVTRGILNKLLHRPTVRLKQLAAEDGSAPYAEAVTELFGLAAVE